MTGFYIGKRTSAGNLQNGYNKSWIFAPCYTSDGRRIDSDLLPKMPTAPEHMKHIIKFFKLPEGEYIVVLRKRNGTFNVLWSTYGKFIES